MQALYALILSFIIGLILFWGPDLQVEIFTFCLVQGDSHSSIKATKVCQHLTQLHPLMRNNTFRMG